MIKSKEIQFTLRIEGETRDSFYAKLSPLGFRLRQNKLFWSSAFQSFSQEKLQEGETRMVISSGHPTGDSELFLITFAGVTDGCQAIMTRFFDSFEKVSITMVQYNIVVEEHSFNRTFKAVQEHAQDWKVSFQNGGNAIIDTPFPTFNIACILWDHQLCFMTRGLQSIKNINTFIRAIEGDYNASIRGYIDVFAPRKMFNIFTYEQFEQTTLF